MSDDIEHHLTEKLTVSGKFFLQIDESNDISGAPQLPANGRYIDGYSIKDFTLLQRNGKPYIRKRNILGN